MDTESKLLKWKGIVVHLIHNQTLVHVTVYSLVGVVSSTFNRNRSYLIIVFLILKYLLPANSIGTMGLHQDEERTHTQAHTHVHFLRTTLHRAMLPVLSIHPSFTHAVTPSCGVCISITTQPSVSTHTKASLFLVLHMLRHC